MRPGYTIGTLATALRAGVDPAGHYLASIMPRYQLTDADVAALADYLRTLSAHISPGASKSEIRLATVFSDQVPSSERNAAVSTLQAYVSWHNLYLKDDLDRHTFSPYNRSEFVPIERRWSLAVWELKGKESSWRSQLEAKYEKDPVFAIVGGKVHGSWNGPADFCDEHRLPCLFPDTPLPKWPTHPYSYTVYFSAGLLLEAKVAARFVAGVNSQSHTVVQIVASDPLGEVPASAFGRELHARAPSWHQRSVVFQSPKQLTAELNADTGSADPLFVVWPGLNDNAILDAIRKVSTRASLIILPSSAIAASKAIKGRLRTQLRFVDPYELTMSSHPKSFETRAWMHARRLPTDHIQLRFKEYYAMSLLDAALFDIGNDLYRDYLLERIEDESQKDLNPGMFPYLSIGPGQRFAAKIAEVVRFDPRQPNELEPVTPWLTP